MEIIGLSGYARSGKDEAAKILVEEFGFKRVAFADKLREVLYQLNPVIWPTPEWVAKGHYNPMMLQEIIDEYTWDGYKETPHGPEIRRLLQRLGTEAGRQTLWDSIWIDAAFAPYENGNTNIVVTDCRFPNEAEAIYSRGGRMWRIMREGVGPANDHPSETSLDNWRFDAYIHNDATLEDFRKSVIRKWYEQR